MGSVFWAFKKEVMKKGFTDVAPNSTLYPTYNFYFSAIHPEGHAGKDYVAYMDGNGETKIKYLQRSGWIGDNWVDAPCTLIVANKILSSSGAAECTP